MSDLYVWCRGTCGSREMNEEAANAHLEGMVSGIGNSRGGALTWGDWCAKLQRELGRELPPPGHQQLDFSLSDRELARLAFFRWLYDTGRIVPGDEPATHNP